MSSACAPIVAKASAAVRRISLQVFSMVVSLSVVDCYWDRRSGDAPFPTQIDPGELFASLQSRKAGAHRLQPPAADRCGDGTGTVWDFVNPVFAGKGKCVASQDDAFPLKDHMNAMLNMVHRAYRYGADYRGCKDKT